MQNIKHSFFIFLLLSLTSYAQDSTIINKDNPCNVVKVSKINDKQNLIYVRDTCHNYYVKFYGKIFPHEVINGFYAEYFDKNSIYPKILGFQFNSHPVGFWQEFYENGNILQEGSCTIISLFSKEGIVNHKLNLYFVNLDIPTDTIEVQYSRNLSDSISKLVKYGGRHQFDIEEMKKGLSKDYKPIGGITFPEEYPLKNGIWKYYNEKGELIKTEYYNLGRLISEHKKNE